ncbi:hypothetical protein ACFQRB_03695 [Halobaculum litoreum]|uniref:Secreted protein n=1 Tax=Halobaculum litoreum TaxID=3031998 RepID=A0ABD5XS35_9EURY
MSDRTDRLLALHVVLLALLTVSQTTTAPRNRPGNDRAARRGAGGRLRRRRVGPGVLSAGDRFGDRGDSAVAAGGTRERACRPCVTRPSDAPFCGSAAS